MSTVCVVCETENEGADCCAFCTSPLGAAPEVTGALPRGTRLQNGAFAVGRVLGIGGFGITYVGLDRRLHRVVAIKEFFPYGSLRHGATVHPGKNLSPAVFQAARDRFLHEAQVAGRFQHPNIVHVYTFFEENDTGYMVMELLRGETLCEVLDRGGPVSEEVAIGYVLQVAEALRIVHSAGFVHRDLKPDNIFLTTEGRVVLLDFGTAKEQAPGLRPVTALVSPGYAPPEQYLTSYQPDPRTDVYALAATLYHLLTGTMPLEAPERTAGRDMPHTTLLNPHISPHVDSAIADGMALEPAQRPPTITAFVARLRAARSGQAAAVDATAPLPPESTTAAQAESPVNEAVPVLSPAASMSPPSLAPTVVVPAPSPAPTVAAPAPSPAPTVAAPAPSPPPSLAPTVAAPAVPPVTARPPAVGAVPTAVPTPLMMPDLAASLPSTAGAGGTDPDAPSLRAAPIAPLNTPDCGPMPPPLLTPLARMGGHLGIIRTVDFTPDGEWVLSGSEDKTVRRWGVRSREPHGVLTTHDAWVSCVRAAPDGRTVATSSHDKTVRLIDLASGAVVRSMRGAGAALSVAFSPDGTRLAGSFIDGIVVLWSAEGQELARTPSIHQSIWTVAFSPDGQRLAFGTWADACIKLWDVAAWREAGLIDAQCGGIRTLAWSPDGRALAATAKDRAIRVWDAASLTETMRLEGHHGAATSVVWHPSGQYLASSGIDKSIRLWDVTARRCVQTLAAHEGEVLSIAFSDDGAHLASGSQDDRVGLFKTAG